MTKAYCLKCNRELEVTKDGKGYEVSQCPDCDGEGFIAGTKGLKLMEDGKITCVCDDPSLSLKMHLNMSPRHYYEYTCKCGNSIIKN